MDSLFAIDFFQGNRQRLRSLVAARPEFANDQTLIVVTANGLMQRTADNTYPFAQDSNFWYLTGSDLPDVTLVMSNDDEYLIVPSRSSSREAFDGAIDHVSLSALSGVVTVFSEEEGWTRFRDKYQEYPHIATPAAPPQYIDQIGMYTNPSRARLAAKLAEVAPKSSIVDIRQDIASLRVVKQPAELAAIERAIKVTQETLAALTAPEKFQLYHNEYEIEADLTREFRRQGAKGHAFAPIVAGGKRACTLHNTSNEQPLDPDTLVVLDVGAEIEHYAADITRTVVYGDINDRQQSVLDAVLDVQAYALTLLKPGVLLKEYEAAVGEYMGQKLQELGLIELSDDKEKNHVAIRSYYPHATSHFLGLDVHDVGDYMQPLAEDMVLTCEPGIYIPAEGIGVRIEDDILITHDGNRVLGIEVSST